MLGATCGRFELAPASGQKTWRLNNSLCQKKATKHLENYDPPMNVRLCYVNKREQSLIIVHCFPASFHSFHIALGKHGKEEREQPCRTIPSLPAVPSRGSCKRVASMMTHGFWCPCRFQRGGKEGRNQEAKVTSPASHQNRPIEGGAETGLALWSTGFHPFWQIPSSALNVHVFMSIIVVLLSSALVDFKPKMFVLLHWW